jgi:hypothetical protein
MAVVQASRWPPSGSTPPKRFRRSSNGRRDLLPVEHLGASRKRRAEAEALTRMKEVLAEDGRSSST